MSPLFPNVPTTLDLNGPELSFTTQPVGTSCSIASGIATFTGIATATFPADQSSRNSNTGAISITLTNGGNISGTVSDPLLGYCSSSPNSVFAAQLTSNISVVT